MRENNIYVSGLVNDSIVDGPGLRFVIFTQGCDKRCKGCHNPTTQPMEGGVAMNAFEIFEKIENNPILTGVTLSGGEPFLQAKELLPLVEKIKNELGLNIAAYTGYTFDDLLLMNEDILKLVKMCDVIIDGPFIQELKSLNLNFRGSSNQRIIDVQESLLTKTIILNKEKNWNPKQDILRC